MKRKILALIAGLVVAWVLYTAIQMLTYLISPSVDVDFNDMESKRRFMASIPAYAYAIVLLGYAVGSFAAGFIIRKIVPASGIVWPLIAGGLLMIGWIINLYSLPHPLSVAVLGFFMYIPFTVLGHRIGSSGIPGDAPAEDEASGATSAGDEEGSADGE